MGPTPSVAVLLPSLIVAGVSGLFSIIGVLITKFARTAVPSEVHDLESQNEILTTLIAELRTENLALRHEMLERDK